MATTAGIDATAGALGSAASLAITYPLQSVSTWQALNLSSETEDVQQSWASNTLLAMLPSPVRDMAMYSTTIGWAPLYAGFLPALGATALSQALYFYLYSAARQLIVARAAKHSPAHKSAAPAGALSVFGSTAVASFAGCINVLATNPIWIIATQLMALQKSPNPADRTKGAWDVAVDLYNQGGVGTFWQGVMPAIVMVSNPTIQYILYEWLTTKMVSFRRLASTPSSHTRVQKGSAPSLLLGGLDVFMLSAVAKLGATLATYPLLVIKSRLQAANASTAAEARYSGVLDALIRILGTEGVAGLFKGLRAKLLQTVFAPSRLLHPFVPGDLAGKAAADSLGRSHPHVCEGEVDSGCSQGTAATEQRCVCGNIGLKVGKERFQLYLPGGEVWLKQK